MGAVGAFNHSESLTRSRWAPQPDIGFKQIYKFSRFVDWQVYTKALTLLRVAIYTMGRQRGFSLVKNQ